MVLVLYHLKPDIVIGELSMNSALGKHYRKGITAIELIETFLGDTAEQSFDLFRWDGKPDKCPICETEGKVPENPIRNKPLPYYCNGCRSHFSCKPGSLTHISHIGFQKWVVSIFVGKRLAYKPLIAKPKVT